MKLSIRLPSPSRALLLASCLLMPRAVLSEKIFLDNVDAFAPGINRLVDLSSRLQYRMLSGRSLEENLDPIFGEFFDDDTYLQYLLGIDIDENLVQCLEETDSLYSQFPNMEEDAATFAEDVTFSSTMNSEKFTITMEYPEESIETLRQKCADVGGYFETMTGEIKCLLFDSEMQMNIETSISGFSNCLANTASCKSSERMLSVEFLMMSLEAGGNSCELVGGVVTQTPPPPPPPPPPATPVADEKEPEPEVPSATTGAEEEEPKAEEESTPTTTGAEEEEPKAEDESDSESSAALDSSGSKRTPHYFTLIGFFVAASSFLQM